MSDTIKFDKKCTPATEYVVLRVIDRHDQMKVAGLLMPAETFSNQRLGFYQIESVGKKASDEYGIKVGDYVVADRLAQCYKTEPVAVMKYTNIIAKTNEDNTKFYPLRNMVFVKDEPRWTKKVDGLTIKTDTKQLNIGEIVAMNVDEDINPPYKVGDKVMISKGGDVFQIGTENFFIYKQDLVVCKVED